MDPAIAKDPDWELTTYQGRRCLRLLVRKAAVPGGMSVSVWWSRILKGEPRIDVEALEGRQRDKEKSHQRGARKASSASDAASEV